jgi:predicted TIM-barrel fold metal-dependent hydrolase
MQRSANIEGAERTGNEVVERALIISSDGHASARMDDYRPYLPRSWHAEFDVFCELYRTEGTRNFERKAVNQKLDPDVAGEWVEQILDQGRHEGLWDAKRRFKELDAQGIAAETLFPDFGLPFELYSPILTRMHGYIRTPQQIDVANTAYNRWLVDFCSVAPERLAGLALLGFDDVDAALREIMWAHETGLKGIVLPAFDEDVPLFDQRFDRIWSLLEELEMPIHSHIAISAVTRRMPPAAAFARTQPKCMNPLLGPQLFFDCHQLLTHLIWGGVFERHPKLQAVFTEQGSGWVINALRMMDHSWEDSFQRRDTHEVVRHRPSEYFERQCHLGASLFSRAEAQARHEIGVGRIMIGADYPHHEGTWGVGPGTVEYLRATIGAAGVPLDEARGMIGGNAADLYRLNVAELRKVAEQIGPSVDELLTPPTDDWYPRGDVKRPLV